MNLIIQQARQELKKRDWEARKKALESLSDCGDPDALALFEEFLSTETDRDLTAIAVECKSRLERALEATKAATGIDLDQEEDPHRAHLAPVYDEKTLEMVKQLESEDSKYVRATLVKELGKTKDPSLIKVIANYLTDPDARVVANTVEALGMMKSPVILQYILPLIDHPNPRVKANVNKILYRFDADLVLGNLKEMIVSTKERVRASAIFALTQNPSVESLDILLMGRDDPSPPLKVRIAKEIMGMKAIIFLKSLKDPRKLSMYLFGVVGGIFFLYFTTIWVLGYVDSISNRNRFAVAAGSEDEDSAAGPRGRVNQWQAGASRIGQKISRDHYSSAVSNVMDDIVERIGRKAMQLPPGIQRKGIFEIYSDSRMISVLEYWEKDDFHRTELAINAILAASEEEPINEHILFNCLQILLRIYQRTDRKDKVPELMKLIDKKCPTLASINGGPSVGEMYTELSGAVDTFAGKQDFNSAIKDSKAFQDVVARQGLNDQEQKVLLEVSSALLDNMKHMGN